MKTPGAAMTRQSKDPAALIPLKHSTYRVLLALADGERHGYAIMQTLSEMTRGRETILPGTLYAALARMVDEGLIEMRDGPRDEASAVARAESERLRALLEIAQAQRIISGGTR